MNGGEKPGLPESGGKVNPSESPLLDNIVDPLKETLIPNFDEIFSNFLSKIDKEILDGKFSGRNEGGKNLEQFLKDNNILISYKGDLDDIYELSLSGRGMRFYCKQGTQNQELSMFKALDEWIPYSNSGGVDKELDPKELEDWIKFLIKNRDNVEVKISKRVVIS